MVKDNGPQEPICVQCEYCVRSYGGTLHHCHFGHSLIRDDLYYVSGYMRWSALPSDLPECRDLNGNGQCRDFSRLHPDVVEEAEEGIS